MTFNKFRIPKHPPRADKSAPTCWPTSILYTHVASLVYKYFIHPCSKGARTIVATSACPGERGSGPSRARTSHRPIGVKLSRHHKQARGERQRAEQSVRQWNGQ